MVGFTHSWAGAHCVCLFHQEKILIALFDPTVLHNVLGGEAIVFEAEAFTVALRFGSRDGWDMNTNSSVV